MYDILFVDDDENLLSGFKRAFRKRYKIDTATSGKMALQLLSEGKQYSVVVSDMRMPEMSGVELLAEMSEKWPDPVRIMLTGNSDQETAVAAVNDGHVWQFLNKPCANDELISTIDAALEFHKLRKMEQDLLEKTLGGSVKLMVDMLQLACPGHFERSRLLRDPALFIAEKAGLQNLWEIRLAALLCNIGLVSFPDSMLEKLSLQEDLAPEIAAVFETHPAIAAKLIEGIPRLEGVADIIRHQLPTTEENADMPKAAAIFQLLNAILPTGANTWPLTVDVRAAEKRCANIPETIVEAAIEWFDKAAQETETQHREHMMIEASRLLPGDRLEADLLTTDGILLLRKGHDLTREHIMKIRHQAKISPLSEPVAISRIVLTQQTGD